MPKRATQTRDSRSRGLPERELTAYHEAGHAVLYVLFGLPFNSVNVFDRRNPAPRGARSLAGVVESDWRGDWPNWALPWCAGYRFSAGLDYSYRMIGMLFAGEITESLYSGASAYQSGKYDRVDIKSIVNEVIGFEDQDTLESVRTATHRTLKQRAVWAAVRGVAKALLDQRSLPASTVRRIVRDALRAKGSGPQVPTFKRAFARAIKHHARQTAAV